MKFHNFSPHLTKKLGDNEKITPDPHVAFLGFN